MKNHLGIFVGSGMLIVAVLVVMQTVGNDASLPGVVWEEGRQSSNVEDRRSEGSSLCANSTLSLFACMSCCTEAYGEYNGFWNPASREEFFESCVNTCNSSFSSSLSSQYTPSSSWASSFSNYSACANPANCGRGFLGECDAQSCLQQFNMGYCIDGGRCATVTVRCADQTACSRASVRTSSSSTSSSSPSSGNSSSF